MTDTKQSLNPAALRQFTGTEKWYRHPFVRTVLYTDGVKYVAEQGGAYWLIDDIAFAQRGDKRVAAEKAAFAKKTEGAANELFAAMDGWGTDEKKIFAALRGKSAEEIKAIKAAYHAKTKRSLEADLTAELSGNDLKEAKALLSQDPVQQKVAALQNAMQGFGTDEKKVKQNLEARISSMNAEDAIYEVVIPMEDYVDLRNGKRVVAQRKMFPGYLLVRSELDDKAWFVIRNTPGVTGFVGQGAKPSPLPRRDVEAFLVPKGTEEQVATRAKPRLEYEVGETVRVFVLNAGPSVDSSFHVVGTIFEDVIKEGIHLQRGNAGNWGSQAVDLSPAQGAIVEMHFDEDGLYPIVTHAFNLVGRGALGVFQAGDGDPLN